MPESGQLIPLRRRQWLLLGFVLAGHLLLAVLYGLVVPLGEAPDEVDHYSYVRYLMSERRLPEGPTITQGKHPPLYYALAAFLAAGTDPSFDFVRANPDFSLLSQAASPNLLIHTSLEAFPFRDGPLVMHLARLLSAVLSTVTIWAIYRLGLELFPGRHELALGAAAAIAFVPGFLFINGSVNNDNLAACVSAIVAFLCARAIRRGATSRRAVLLGLLLGLGLLAKVGTLAVWPGAALALSCAAAPNAVGDRAAGASPRARGLSRRAWDCVRWNGLAFGVASIVAAPWLMRNWRLYGDPLGWNLVRSTVDLRTAPLVWSDLIWLLSGWFTTFWGRFGGAAHIRLPMPLYVVLGVLTLVAILGLAWRSFRSLADGTGDDKGERRARRLIWAVLSLVAASTALSVIRYSALALGTDQARLLYPALAAIGVFFFCGWVAWVPTKYVGKLASMLPVLGFMLALAVLLFFVQPIYAPPKPVELSGLRDLDGSSATVFDGGIALLGHSPSLPEASAGGDLKFALYWQANLSVQADLRTEVWVTGPSGLIVAFKRSPGGGRLSTDRWPIGEAYADVYSLRLPEWLDRGEYSLSVGVREFPSERWLSADGDAEAFQRLVTTITVWE